MMHLSSIKPHPLFHFIEVGKVIDYAKLHGYADNPSFICDEDEWTFNLDGLTNLGSYRSKAEAIEAAEKILFNEHPIKAAALIDQAIASQQFELALNLAERRGFWLGKAQRQKECSKIIKSALDILSPLARPQH